MPWTAADWIVVIAFPILTIAALVAGWRRGPRAILIVMVVGLAAAVTHAAALRVSILPLQWAVISFMAGVCRACRFRPRAVACAAAVSLSACGLLAFGAHRAAQRQMAWLLPGCPVAQQQVWWMPQDDGSVAATASPGTTITADRVMAAASAEVMPLPDEARAQLEEAHEQVTRNFVASAGFGLYRMIPMPRWPDLCLAGTCPSPIPDDPDTSPTVDEASSPQVVASRASSRPSSNSSVSDSGPTFRWVADRVQLVSLLRQSVPRVYDVGGTPTMENLKNTPTRDLDDFESAALARLEGGEDVVVFGRRNAILMVGSLRAETSCLSCHAAKENALLGAFTYRLVPRAKARDADQDQPFGPANPEGSPASGLVD